MISVIIPVFNLENYILRTLTSLDAQTDRSFEVILVNDGSTDQSVTVINQFLTQHPEFPATLINQENAGVSAARNKGLERARYDYVYFLDGDDYVHEALIAEVSFAIHQNHPDMICFGYHHVTPEDRIKIRFDSLYTFPDQPLSGTDMLNLIIKNKQFKIWIGSAVYNRLFLKRHNHRFTEGCQSGEDIEFIFKALIHARKVYCIDRTLSYYLVREGSLSRRYNLAIFQAIDSIKRIRSYARQTGQEEIIQLFDSQADAIMVNIYIYKFNQCLSRLLQSNPNSRKITILSRFHHNLEVEYPGLHEDMTERMQKLRHIKPKLRVHVTLFRLSPVLYQRLFQLRQ